MQDVPVTPFPTVAYKFFLLAITECRLKAVGFRVRIPRFWFHVFRGKKAGPFFLNFAQFY